MAQRKIMLQSIRLNSSKSPDSQQLSSVIENRQQRFIESQKRVIRVIDLKRNEDFGFGFSLKGEKPCQLISVRGHALDAGLREADILVEVDGKNVTDWPHDELVALLWTWRRTVRLKVMDSNDKNALQTNEVVRPLLEFRGASAVPELESESFLEMLRQIFSCVLDLRNGPFELYDSHNRINLLATFIRSFEVKRSALCNPRTVSSIITKLTNWSQRPINRTAHIVRIYMNEKNMFVIEPIDKNQLEPIESLGETQLCVPEQNLLACGRFQSSVTSMLMVLFVKLSSRRLCLLIVRRRDDHLSNSRDATSNRISQEDKTNLYRDLNQFDIGARTTSSDHCEGYGEANMADQADENGGKNKADMQFPCSDAYKFRREGSKSHERESRSSMPLWNHRNVANAVETSLVVNQQTSISPIIPCRVRRKSISALDQPTDNNENNEYTSKTCLVTQSRPEEDPTVFNWSVSFSDVLNNPVSRQMFRKFLRIEFSEENLDFWLACNQYGKTESCAERQRQARTIWADFLNPNSNRLINVNEIDDRIKDACFTQIESESNESLQIPHRELFLNIQVHIYNLMKYDAYPRFLKSKIYKDYLSTYKTTGNVSDNHDDDSIAGFSSDSVAQTLTSTAAIPPPQDAPVKNLITDKQFQEKTYKRIYSLLPWTKALMKWKKYPVKNQDARFQSNYRAPSHSPQAVNSGSSNPQGTSSQEPHMRDVGECAIELPDRSMFRVLIETPSPTKTKTMTLEYVLKEPLAKRGYVWFRTTLRNAFSLKRIPYSLNAYEVVGQRIKLYADRAIFVIVIEHCQDCLRRQPLTEPDVIASGSVIKEHETFDRHWHTFAVSTQKESSLRIAIESIGCSRLPAITSLISEGFLYTIDGERRIVSSDEQAYKVDNRCLFLTQSKYASFDDVPMYGVDFGGCDHFDGFLEENNLNVIEHFSTKDTAVDVDVSSADAANQIDKTPSPPTLQNPALTIFRRFKRSISHSRLISESSYDAPISDDSFHEGDDFDDDDTYSLPDTFRRSQRNRFKHTERETRAHSHDDSFESCHQSMVTDAECNSDQQFTIIDDEMIQEDSLESKHKLEDDDIIRALSSPRNREPINWP